MRRKCVTNASQMRHKCVSNASKCITNASKCIQMHPNASQMRRKCVATASQIHRKYVAKSMQKGRYYGIPNRLFSDTYKRSRRDTTAKRLLRTLSLFYVNKTKTRNLQKPNNTNLKKYVQTPKKYPHTPSLERQA